MHFVMRYVVADYSKNLHCLNEVEKYYEYHYAKIGCSNYLLLLNAAESAMRYVKFADYPKSWLLQNEDEMKQAVEYEAGMYCVKRYEVDDPMNLRLLSAVEMYYGRVGHSR